MGSIIARSVQCFFDVIKGMEQKVPFTKLLQMDLDMCPYLAILLVAVLYRQEM